MSLADRRTTIMVAVLTLLATTLVLIAGPVAPARAVTISVNCGAGDKIQDAVNLAAAGDVIDVSGSCVEHVDITSGISLTIQGQGAESTLVAGNGGGSVFDVTGAGTALTLRDMTIRLGNGVGAGVHILTPATATLEGLIIENNSAGVSNGGGVHTNTTVILRDSIVRNNFASAGAGVRAFGTATVTIEESTISDNAATIDGAGISVAAGSTVELTKSTVSDNTAVDGGGALNDGTLTITGSVISDNTAVDGGGIHNRAGTVTVTDSTVGPNTASGSGGGIYNINATTTVAASTISSNEATFLGGGLYNHGATGSVALTNATLSGNMAGAGGGAYNTVDASLTLTHVTITDNTATNNAGGYRNFATVTLEATIVAGNTGLEPDCDGTAPVSSGYNLIGDSTDCNFPAGGTGDQVGTAAAPIDPLVGPLQDNGGPVFTHALLTGSSAIDAIPAASCTATVDARGVSRPQGGGCDIGAYEADPGDTVGLVDVATGAWHLRNSAGVVTSFLYGNPGDLPIAGDWDGDGDATPGLYRQSDGFFYSRNSNTTGIADAECFAGDPSDVPIAGDWDGDGDDNLGIYRPSEQMFYLFTITCTGSPMGAAQISFLFGNPGDKPVAGDWDGDGIDEVGLHRESTGFFYWRNTLDTGVASDEIFFGDPGDRFVAGDWGIVDGSDTPGLFRPSDVTFYFRHTLTQGVADSQFTWTGAGTSWLPVAGAFGLG